LVEERRVGLIPYLVVQGAMGPKEYGVLLTDRQTIFVLEKRSKAMMGGVLGGAIGAAIAHAATSRRSFDYENTPPDVLAADPKNVAIPHGAMSSLQLKRTFGSYALKIEYTNVDGKQKKLQAIVSPPPSLVKSRKAQGVNRKQASAEYANQVREAFQAAMPPTVAARAEWRL